MGNANRCGGKRVSLSGDEAFPVARDSLGGGGVWTEPFRCLFQSSFSSIRGWKPVLLARRHRLAAISKAEPRRDGALSRRPEPQGLQRNSGDDGPISE